MKHGIMLFTCLISLAPSFSVFAQDTLEQIEQVGIERAEEGQATQARVDDIHERKRGLVDEYRAQLKLVDNLESYMGLLDQQLGAQAQEIDILTSSVADVAVVERQILPLMLKMIDSLGEFVKLDVPFLIGERTARVGKLRDLLGRSDVTVAEKTRRVFEAYQIETDYGRTVEAYTAKLELDAATFDAEFLRVGRINLLYKTVGGGEVGYWDSVNRRWQSLDATPWRRLIDQGLKVAKQEVAPELLWIALNPKGVETI